MFRTPALAKALCLKLTPESSLIMPFVAWLARLGRFGVRNSGDQVCGCLPAAPRRRGACSSLAFDSGLGDEGKLPANGFNARCACANSEPIDVTGADVKPGMVVSFDRNNPGKLVASATAYDTCVAGVVTSVCRPSPRSGLRPNAAVVQRKHRLLLTGRAYCYADGGAAGIRPGDILTTSDVSGYAKKAVDLERAQGAIVGKAMTSLSVDEKGLVLTLVTLR